MKTLNELHMKRCLVIFLVLLVFCSCSKDPDPTEVHVVITQHPSGGKQQESVSVTFDAQLKGEVKPIELTIEWWWESGDQTTQQLVDTERITINTSGTTSRSAVYRTAPGYILLNYYWAKIRWSDDTGQKEVESGKAYFTH